MTVKDSSTKIGESEIKTALATLFAPWAAPIVLIGWQNLEAVVKGKWPVQFYYGLPWIVIIAVFTSYIALFAIGLPLVRVLCRYGRLNLLFLTACGGIAGAAVFMVFDVIFAWSLGSQPDFDILGLLAIVLYGGVLGGSVAVSFGLIAGIPFTIKDRRQIR